MSDRYLQTERELKRIINSHVKPTNDKVLQIMIYYKNKKLRNLLVKNNSNSSIQDYNVVYQYTCNQELCTSTQTCYIGHTTSTIKDRFKQHTSIKRHFRETHDRNITGSQMLPDVKILATNNNKIELPIQEAIMIKEIKPSINVQCGDFNRTLKIFH